jgi:hypothetical protein
MRNVIRFVAAAVLAVLSVASHAGTFRAYLSITGNDANPCSLGAPCRLTAAALAAVNDGGEIWFMDSGNFNIATLDITKSVSIVAVPGAIASIFALNGPAVNIATPGVKVSLKNLVIKSLAGAGSTSGIVVTSGASLIIENCTISDMPINGIDVRSATKVLISDTSVRNNASYGIFLDTGAIASMSRVTAAGNGFGIITQAGAGDVTFDVRDSIVTGNTTTGIVIASFSTFTVKAAVANTQVSGNAYGFSIGASGTVRAGLSGNLVANNSTAGINLAGGSSIVLASDNTVSGNGTGISISAGTFNSTASNSVSGNTTNVSGGITTVGKI